MRGKIASLVLCLAIFHTPDGKIISVDTRHIIALRSAENVKQHLAPGTNTVLYVSGQNFAITETPDEAKEAIRDCIGEEQ
jgi:hypothetical protein